MNFSLEELGFPMLDEIEARTGLTPRQYYDVLKWMGEARLHRPWWRVLFQRVWPVTGWDVDEFIRSVSRERGNK